MVELGFGGGSNPPPTQIHILTDPTLPNPIYTPSPTPSPNPTLPFPTLPNPTQPHTKPPHPSTNYLYLNPTLPFFARHWVKHGMVWNGMEFYHEFFKGTFSIYLQPPSTINPTDHLIPTPQTLTLIPLTMTPSPRH